jgi:hypothetical protein
MFEFHSTCPDTKKVLIINKIIKIFDKAGRKKQVKLPKNQIN